MEREKNLSTLDAFYSPETRAPGGTVVRAKLFAPDGKTQKMYPFGPNIRKEPEKLDAAAFLAETPDAPADWEFTLENLWSTNDPNYFWVECRGKGTVTFEGTTGPYSNHYMHSFQMGDGKVKLWREWYNTLQIRKAIGMEIPWHEGMGGLLDTFKVSERPLYKKSPDDPALREKNLKALEHYNSSRGAAGPADSNKWKAQFYAPDAMMELPYHFNHTDPQAHKLSDLPPREGESWFVFRMINMWSTDDPNLFVTEEKGYTAVPGRADFGYSNHYVFTYLMEDGKIKYYREFLDPQRERMLYGNEPENPPVFLYSW